MALEGGSWLVHRFDSNYLQFSLLGGLTVNAFCRTRGVFQCLAKIDHIAERMGQRSPTSGWIASCKSWLNVFLHMYTKKTLIK